MEQVIAKNRYLVDEGRGDAAICLTDKTGRHTGLAWIDLEDLERVKPWGWWLTDAYAMGWVVGYQIRLHQFLMQRFDTNSNLEVDHINKNGLDNRKSNLRIITRSINLRNSKIRKDNTSGYPGINWSKRLQVWMARIRNNQGGIVHLGCFKDKQDAINIRKALEKEYGYL